MNAWPSPEYMNSSTLPPAFRISSTYFCTVYYPEETSARACTPLRWMSK